MLGSWGIGESVLRSALETNGVSVDAVFTRLADSASSDPYRNMVADLAASAGIPVHPPKAASGADGVALLAQLAPDVILSAAHPTLLAPNLLSVPRFGALNLHGSLLPKHRGTSPVNWALIRDEAETGLTMHYIDEGMDTGDVIYQERVAITDTDTPGTLADRIRALAPQLIKRALTTLVAGHALPRIRQDDTAASYSPRLKGADLSIDWTKSARAVWSFIRGTSQRGLGARTTLAGSEFRVWSAIEPSQPHAPSPINSPGTVTAASSERIEVQCGDRVLEIPLSSLERESGVSMPEVGSAFSGSAD
ncbi:MAG: methionyl-tRNA formyltransferase [Gemmatimonadaceae bacterium]|nr:methionyl-tRNA formyltransferase [Gemmatimonadaceae bacterium]